MIVVSAQTVGSNIRKWMKQNNFASLRKAAPVLGLHYTYLGRLLNGQVNPSMTTLEQVAEKMGTTVAALVSADQQAS